MVSTVTIMWQVKKPGITGLAQVSGYQEFISQWRHI